MIARIRNDLVVRIPWVLAALACGPANESNNVHDRIRAVELGLLPAVLVDGRDVPIMPLDVRMSYHGVPGVSIAVIDSGRIAWARGYGTARPQVGATPQTRFQAGAISEAVTAVAVLRLIQDERLELDAPVNAYLTSWELPDHAVTTDSVVSIRRLLTHSAGLTGSGASGYRAGQPIPSLLQLLDGQSPATSEAIRVDFEPGTGWRYSSGGLAVLQQLMTDVTDQPFPALMRELVLDPLDMQLSTFDQPIPDSIESNAATGYLRSGAPVSAGWRVYPEIAAAGLWTTASDLARFVIAVQDAWRGHPDAILDQHLMREALAPQVGNWGLGVAISRSNAPLSFSHSGNTVGYRSFMLGLPETGQGVVVMTNSDAGDDLYGEIVRAVATVYDWPDYTPATKIVTPVDITAFDRLTGEYDAVGFPGVHLRFVTDGSRLIVLGLGRETRLTPSSATVYFDPNTGREFSFEIGEHGHAIGVAVGGRHPMFARRAN